VKSLAGSLLPDKLTKSDRFDIALWQDLAPEQFMVRLYSNGNADDRYLIYGHDTRTEDLHMLDQMVFAIRRLICPLDERFLPEHAALRQERDANPFTHREQLASHPGYFAHLSMPLDEQIAAREDTTLRTAALNLNFAFAPNDYQHEQLRTQHLSGRNPVIGRRILKPLESDDPQQVAEGIQLARWLLENVVLNKDVTEQIEAAINTAEAKHELL
jgi:hypothetical protein